MVEIATFRQLDVYVGAKHATMLIFECSKEFPPDERLSLTDQIRRSSRSVCANIAEAWGKRIYPKHFCSKLTDAEAETEETRSWLDFAAECQYLPAEPYEVLDDKYDHVVRQLVRMRAHPEQWRIYKSADRFDYDP